MLLLLLPISIILLSVFTPNLSTNAKERKVYMFFSFLVIVFFVGLRSIYVGSPDTRTYCTLFETANQTSNLFDFLGIIGNTDKNYFLEEGNFFLLVWLISRFTNSAQVFLVIMTSIMTACVFRFISKHSEDFMLSCVIYICLGSMTFSMNGMRQALAMSICLLAYGFAVKKKFIPFLLLVLFAMTFHVSAFIFLLVYPLCHFSKRYIIPLLSAAVLFMMFSTRLASIYDSLVGKDYASGESMEGGGLVTLAIYLMALILVLLFHKNFENDSKIVSLCALCFVGLVLYSTRYFSTQIFERISYYFYFFIILLIPKLSRVFGTKERPMFSLIVCVLAIALFAYRIASSTMINYQLFFQG